MVKPPSTPDQDLHRHSINILWWYWLPTLNWQLVKSWLIFEDMLSSVDQYMRVGWHTANYWPSVDWVSIKLRCQWSINQVLVSINQDVECVPNEMLRRVNQRYWLDPPSVTLNPIRFVLSESSKQWGSALCTLTSAYIENKFMQAGENDVHQPCIVNIILTQLGELGLFAC